MFYWQSYQVHYAIHIYALFININSKLYILHWNFFIGCSFFYWQLHQVFYAIHIYSLFINKYSIFNIHYWTFNVRFAKTILHYAIYNSSVHRPRNRSERFRKILFIYWLFTYPITIRPGHVYIWRVCIRSLPVLFFCFVLISATFHCIHEGKYVYTHLNTSLCICMKLYGDSCCKLPLFAKCYPRVLENPQRFMYSLKIAFSRQ